jgi:hypothetical protein
MVCVNGSWSTSSPAWNTYKMAPVDVGHHFPHLLNRRSLSHCFIAPNLNRPDVKDKETPPPEEELESEVHHTNPVTSPKLGEGSRPPRHHLDAALDLNFSRVRTPFVSDFFWTHPHTQPRPLAQARCDSSENVPQSHGAASRLSRATIASLALHPSHPYRSHWSRLDQSHTSSFHKILALHLDFNGSERSGTP